jgi:hypothetical protein
MSNQVFILVHDTARQRAAQACLTAQEGYRVIIKPPAKSRIQEERYHAMIGDIADQSEFMGKKMDADDWKRLLIDAFAKVMRDAGTPLHHDGRVVPSLDGQRVVQLGIQSSGFYKAEASQFIEFLFAYGAENGIVWKETEQRGFMEAA